MTAETLRRAAALMRERAEAATPGPWRWEEPSGDQWPQGDESLVVEATGDPVLWGWGYDASGIDGEDADRLHIASWHPAVTLAVARVLEAEADDHDRRVKCVNRMIPNAEIGEVHISPESVNLARLYLGETSR